MAFSIASPYGTYQGLAALKESGGLGVPITDEGIFEAQRALAGEEGIYAEPSAIVGLTAVMQLARQKEIAPDQVVAVVLTSGGLKDYGASRAWLPPVPSAGRTSTARSASSKTAMAWGSRPSLGAAFLGEDTPARIVERARAAEARRLRQPLVHRGLFPDGRLRARRRRRCGDRAHRHRHGGGQSVHAPPGADRDGDRDARRHRARTRRARTRHGRQAMDRRPDAASRRRARSPRSGSASTSSAASGPASA